MYVCMYVLRRLRQMLLPLLRLLPSVPAEAEATPHLY